ncbi:MAG TPA: hypothetical protein VIM65_07090 [Cyclobacteriaceae bacterium]
MKLLRTLSAIVVLSLNVLLTLPVSGQISFDANAMLGINPLRNKDRAKEVMQDNEFVISAKAVGKFFDNPLRLDGYTLDYRAFSLESKGELTLIKGATLTSDTVQIPFYIYLRRDGTVINLPGKEAKRPQHVKVDISTILKYAAPGDQLIIEPVNKEDWQAKRILKLLEGGC